MPRVNYLIATWAGSRYNPSKDYLKVQLKRIFELKHNLDQITVIRPLGSDNDDFYDVGEDILSKIVIINRPANDRSYGQFIYAYQQYTDQFDYYIICEDDYAPNIDNFDSILVNLIEDKGVDYLCGKFGTQCRQDPPRCIMNQGIVKASAFKTMLEKCSPVFPPMGPADGTEQQIFSDYFTNNGLTIADYSNEYSVPYWAKTLTFFTKSKYLNTIFVPYQCLDKNIAPHFLSTLQYSKLQPKHFKFLSEVVQYHYNAPRIHIGENEEIFTIEEPIINLWPHEDEPVLIGYFKLSRFEGKLFIDCKIHPHFLYKGIEIIIYERISWENRGELLFLHINSDTQYYKELKDLNWVDYSNGIIHKDHNKW